ncbi:MAG: peptidoglycan-binding protein [Pseudomonadota bacterium]
MAKIFISYRRQDSQHAVDRLQEFIKPYLKNPKRDLFVDVDNIPIGMDFEAHLQTKISQCHAVLAVIGPGWLTAQAPNGKPRLDSPDDFVRTEIAAALQRGIPVVPVLLDGTPMPRVDQLPVDIRGLVTRHGAQLDRKSFRADVDHIMSGLGFSKRKRALSIGYAGLAWLGGLVLLGIIGGVISDMTFSNRSTQPLSSTTETNPTLAVTEAEPKAGEAAKTEISIDPARGDLVQRLQTALTTLKYYDGAIDGIAGKDTNAAAKMFAEDQEIKTLDIVFDDFADLERTVQRAEEAAASTLGPFILASDRKAMIERYQIALTALGYYQGPIDGQTGSTTHDATKAFSKDYDLTVLRLNIANLDTIERQVKHAEDLVAKTLSGGFRVREE